MIRFPLFERLNVDGYALYPGLKDDPGLDAHFSPGTTLVMGANGLGKSTLVLLLYRMCTGPTELAGGGGTSELGYSQLSTGNLAWTDSRTFAARVNDGAVDARASLQFSVGPTQFKLTRTLKDLKLNALEVDGQDVASNEVDYQNLVTAAAGVDSFIDWMLIQRYLTFYGDDRRSLVWDRTAQRQLLRLLFLPPEESGTWLSLEREFLRQSTQYRNFRAVLSGEEKTVAREEAKLAKVPTINAELEALNAEAEAIEAQLDRHTKHLQSIDSDRRSAQLAALRAADDRERAYRVLEFARLAEIQSAFPDASTTAAYLVGQIVSGGVCAVCGTAVPEFAQLLEHRIASDDCIVCGSNVSPPVSADAGAFQIQESNLDLANTRLRAASESRDELEHAYAEVLAAVRSLEQRKEAVASRLNQLDASLPDADRKVMDRRANITVMRATAESMRTELDEAQDTYQEYVSSRLRTIAERKDDVKAAFAKFAEEFLVESCELVWDSYLAPIGQINEPTKFYVFEVDMTGGAQAAATRRERSQDVSESQREFIDLAFRMALISVAGESHQGSLVIDTPESSLDAVFAPRAARVLAEFGTEAPENRLIVTSNLIDGALIPTLLGLAKIKSRDDSRIVDLIALAEPTAAVRDLRDAYDAAVSSIFDRVNQDAST